MKKQILLEALKFYSAQVKTLSEEEHSDVTDMIGELGAVIDADYESTLFEDTAYLIPSVLWFEVLNHATYDLLGRMLKKNTDVSFENYVFECRKGLGYWDCIPRQYLRPGYDIICDLWHENEQEGAHHPDGSFNINYLHDTE